MKRFVLITTIIASIILIILVLSLLARILYFKPDEMKNKKDGASEKIESVQVNILNASGRDGLAAQARIYLRKKGIDVVEISNFAKLEANSYIIDRVGDFASAGKLAREIGMKDSLIVSGIDSSLFLKCSLVLGLDYKKYYPFKVKELTD